jgi:hypothetical protein
MSSEKSTPEEKTKLALFNLLNDVEAVIESHVQDMEPACVTYALTNFSQHLTLDLVRYFERRRESDLKTSPFDDIINND